MVEFRMPSLGADMEAGTLVEWLVKPGDRVKRGDIVAVVETQKGAIEIEIFETGQIEQILVDLDTKVPVGTPLARIRTEARRTAWRCRQPLRRRRRRAVPLATAACRCAAPVRAAIAAARRARRRGARAGIASRAAARRGARHRSLDGRPEAVLPARSLMPTSSAVSARPPLRRKRSERSGSISTPCERRLPPPWRDRSGKSRTIISSIRSTSRPASNG